MRILFLAFSAYLLSGILAIPLPSRPYASTSVGGPLDKRVLPSSVYRSTGKRISEELFPRGIARKNKPRKEARRKARRKARNLAKKNTPLGSVVWAAPKNTINQPIIKDQHGQAIQASFKTFISHLCALTKDWLKGS